MVRGASKRTRCGSLFMMPRIIFGCALEKIVPQKKTKIGRSTHTTSQNEALVNTSDRYRDVFSSLTGQLKHCKLGKHGIDTGFSSPKRQRFTRFSRWAQDEIQKRVVQMMEICVIRKSESEWRSDCVVGFKKSRTARVCIDYRQLNKVTRKDAYLLCDSQTLFACLHRSAYCTSLDVFNGYYQV